MHENTCIPPLTCWTPSISLPGSGQIPLGLTGKPLSFGYIHESQQTAALFLLSATTPASLPTGTRMPRR